MKQENKLLTLALAVLTGVLVVSASIAVPLLCRPFYYAHIGPYDLTGYGVSEEQIRTAYDQMMDFCLGLRPDFAVGELAFSRSGMEHFADVKVLFLLDLYVLAGSILALMALFALARWKKLRPALLKGHGPGFWGAVGLAVTFVVVGGLAALDFDRAFVIFHALFFPGKTNWIFDWRVDPIILLLPQDFFRNCAILILVLVLMWSAALIFSDLWACKRRKLAGEKAEKMAKLAAQLAANPCQGCPSANRTGGCSGCSGQENKE